MPVFQNAVRANGNGSKPAESQQPKPLPPTYDAELVATILTRVSNGETLRATCRSLGDFNASKFRSWVLDDVDGLANRYARARVLMLQAWADEICEIADDGRNDWMTVTRRNGNEVAVENREVVNRSRLRVDTRKWLMSKLHPEQYGEHVELHGHVDTGPRVIRINVFPSMLVASDNGNGNGSGAAASDYERVTGHG